MVFFITLFLVLNPVWATPLDSRAAPRGELSLEVLAGRITVLETQVIKLFGLIEQLGQKLEQITLRMNTLPLIKSQGYRDGGCSPQTSFSSGWCPDGQKTDFWIGILDYQEGDVMQFQATEPLQNSTKTILHCEATGITSASATVAFIQVHCPVAPADGSLLSYSLIRPTAILQTGLVFGG